MKRNGRTRGNSLEQAVLLAFDFDLLTEHDPEAGLSPEVKRELPHLRDTFPRGRRPQDSNGS
jgi:hypothetical protein